MVAKKKSNKNMRGGGKDKYLKYNLTISGSDYPPICFKSDNTIKKIPYITKVFITKLENSLPRNHGQGSQPATSNNSLINTKPQLEIFADEVKCSHGATIGQLDNDATFYLKSRGIGEEASKVILLHAFASDIINHIKVDAVKNYAEEIINKRINKIKKET